MSDKLKRKVLNLKQRSPLPMKVSYEFWALCAEQVRLNRLDKGYSPDPEYIVGVLE